MRTAIGILTDLILLAPARAQNGPACVPATGSAKVSSGGTIVDQAVTGTFLSNGDCSSSITYDQRINGQPVPKLNLVAHVLDFDAEIRGMSVDPGVTMTCRLKLMSR